MFVRFFVLGSISSCFAPPKTRPPRAVTTPEAIDAPSILACRTESGKDKRHGERAHGSVRYTARGTAARDHGGLRRVWPHATLRVSAVRRSAGGSLHLVPVVPARTARRQGDVARVSTRGRRLPAEPPADRNAGSGSIRAPSSGCWHRTVWTPRPAAETHPPPRPKSARVRTDPSRAPCYLPSREHWWVQRSHRTGFRPDSVPCGCPVQDACLGRLTGTAWVSSRPSCRHTCAS